MITTGVSGCGKDYLLGKLRDHGLLPSGLQVLNFGSELFEQLSTTHRYVRTRDDMRTLLSQEEVRAGALSLVDRIKAMQPVVLNTHVVHRQNDSLITNPDIDRRLRPLSYLYVWADPEEIIQWRAADTSRTRPHETLDQIALHQKIACETTATMANHFGARFTVLHNRDDRTTQNLVVMKQLIDELM